MMNPKHLFTVLALFCVIVVTACNKPPAPANEAAPSQPTQTPPRVLRKVAAQFPKELWNKPGTVSVQAMIGTDGKVGATKVVSSPHAELNPLALDAVKQWQFDPARQDGKPVPVLVTVNVTFDPQPAATSSKK